MLSFVEETKAIISRAKEVHALEKTLTLESVELVAQLERRKAAHMCGLPLQRFAQHIGLTINQYWKRAAAARVIERFKDAKDMLRANETCLSHLALVSAKITDCNSELVLNGIKNKKRRDVEALMSRVTRDGRLLDQEEEVELRVRLKASALALLDQAKAVLAHGGRTPSLDEVLVAALSDLLDKRDPMRKAERAAARKEKVCGRVDDMDSGVASIASSAEKGRSEKNSTAAAQGRSEKDSTAAGQDRRQNSSTAAEQGRTTNEGRRPIKAHVRHEVWLRDGGQCSYVFSNGERCGEKSMVELDHKTMFCRGGGDTVYNLELKCRYHNQAAAEVELGSSFMAYRRGLRRGEMSGARVQ